jgi:hypothetical protein
MIFSAFIKLSKCIISAKNVCVIISVITHIDIIFVLKEYMFLFKTRHKIFNLYFVRKKLINHLKKYNKVCIVTNNLALGLWRHREFFVWLIWIIFNRWVIRFKWSSSILWKYFLHIALSFTISICQQQKKIGVHIHVILKL